MVCPWISPQVEVSVLMPRILFVRSRLEVA